MYFPLVFELSLLYFAIYVHAIPAWEGAMGQTTINSLVPGASYIEAVGPYHENEQYHAMHLSLLHPGQPGNLTILPNSRAPPLFYIRGSRLWQFNNESSILPVNALNTTNKAGFPLQLVVGKKIAGLRGGSWRWQATMLFYDQGSASNSGLYYKCPFEDGSDGVFMFLQPSPTPLGCETMTMHSWSRYTYTNK